MKVPQPAPAPSESDAAVAPEPPRDMAEVDAPLTAPGAPYETAPVLPPEPKDFPFVPSAPKPPVNELPRNELPLFPVVQRHDVTPISVTTAGEEFGTYAADVDPTIAPVPMHPAIEVTEITNPGTSRLVNQFNAKETTRR